MEEVITLYNIHVRMFTNSWYFVDLYNIRATRRRYHFAFVFFTKSWYFVLHVQSMYVVCMYMCVHIGLCCVVVESTDLMWLLHTVAVLVWPI